MHFGEDNQAFRILADNLGEAFWLVGSNGGEIIYVNPAFERIWLQTGADLLRAPRSWLDALHPDDRPRVEQSFDTFLSASSSGNYDEQYRLVRRDDTTRWIHQRIVPLATPAGAPPRHLSLARDITDLKQAQEALTDSSEKLLKLTQQQEAINDAQRTHIAREIHDEFGQALTVLSLDLNWLVKRCPRDESIQNKLGEMRELIDRTAKTVQDITLRLRPANLVSFGLEGALNWYISRFRQQNEGLSCRQTIKLDGVRLDHDRSIALYRILQEALTNITRHAGARTVSVDISLDGDSVTLTVKDDGVGISEQDLSRGDAWGLIGMRERVNALGGGFDIRGGSGRGTQLAVRLPLAESGGSAASHDSPEALPPG